MALLFLENERYGNGNAGVVAATTATDAPIDSAATATSGTKTISATNGSFASGQIILLIDMRTGVRQLNVIDSYVAGTITTKYEIDITVTNGQVLVVNQHQNWSLAAGQTLTAKAWNGTVGGVVVRMANGAITVGGTITGTGKGFRFIGSGTLGEGLKGEGTGGLEGTSGVAANGNGAGGGDGGGGNVEGAAGGGGGHAFAGTAGQVNTVGNKSPGAGGLAVGDGNLDTIFMGGAGGSGAGNGTTTTGAVGAHGGCIVILIAPRITITGSGVSNGNAGSSAASDLAGGGGGGAGGSWLLIGQVLVLGSNLITALGGLGGTDNNCRDGGNGSVGRIAAYYSDSISGTTNPTYTGTKDRTLAPGIFGSMT